MNTPRLVSIRPTGAPTLSFAETTRDTHVLIREKQAETKVVLERMDQWADERPREVFQAIQALRA